MDKTERAALRALAEKATPGPWHVVKHTEDEGEPMTETSDWTIQCGRLPIAYEGSWCHNPENNTRYIAAANPAAITALLTALDAAEAERESLRAALKAEEDTREDQFHSHVRYVNAVRAERDAAIARAEAAAELLRQVRSGVDDYWATTRFGAPVVAAIDAHLAEKSNG